MFCSFLGLILSCKKCKPNFQLFFENFYRLVSLLYLPLQNLFRWQLLEHL